MVICLERGADLRMAQLMPLPHTVLSLASVKSRLVLPFWYQFTQVVLDIRPLNVCVCVCVNFIVCCSELQMDKRDKAILRENHVFLVDNLNLKHEMFKAQLIQAELLSSNDLERLQASGDFVV